MPNPPPQSGGGWRLVPYISASGRCPVREFLRDLKRSNPRAAADFYELWRPRFEKHGPFVVGPPHWEGLGDELYEIRWCGKCRIYCSVEPIRRVLMYMGVVKRWRRFDPEHRRTCDNRRADVRSKDYDDQKREYIYHGVNQKRRENGFT